MSKYPFTKNQLDIQMIDRDIVQRKIIKMYAELVEQYSKELCLTCKTNASIKERICTKNLIPVTTAGDPCPYYNKKDEF